MPFRRWIGNLLGRKPKREEAHITPPAHKATYMGKQHRRLADGSFEHYNCAVDDARIHLMERLGVHTLVTNMAEGKGGMYDARQILIERERPDQELELIATIAERGQVGGAVPGKLFYIYSDKKEPTNPRLAELSRRRGN